MEEIVISSAMILNTKTEILLVRKKGSKYFQLPGGKVKSNEAKFETLKRELFEEINIEVKEENCIFLGIHETNAVNEKNTRVKGFLYEIINIELVNTKIKNEIEEMVWIDKTNYKNYRWAHLAEEFILPIWLKRYH